MITMISARQIWRWGWGWGWLVLERSVGCSGWMRTSHLGQLGHLLCFLATIAFLEAQAILDDALHDGFDGDSGARGDHSKQAAPLRLVVRICVHAGTCRTRRVIWHTRPPVHNRVHLGAVTVNILLLLLLLLYYYYLFIITYYYYIYISCIFTSGNWDLLSLELPRRSTLSMYWSYLLILSTECY